MFNASRDVIVIPLDAGTPQETVGVWCSRCALPSKVRCDIPLTMMSELGVSLFATVCILDCDECGEVRQWVEQGLSAPG